MVHFNFINSISNENLSKAGSAWNKMLERRNNFLNQGNTALKEDVEEKPVIVSDAHYELPDCIKNLSLEEIFEKSQLSDDELENLKKNHANDNFLDKPTDPNEMSKLLTAVENSVKSELVILKAAPLSDEEYTVHYNKIQLKRAHQLLAEYMIGQDLRSISAQRGLKKGSKRRSKDGKIAKKEIIAQRYPHLGSRQIRDFQHLELKYIWEAIEYAFKTGQDLTRSLALSSKIKKSALNKPKSLPSNLKRWYANDDDFETTNKVLKLTEEMGATSLFANVGIGTSLLEKHLKKIQVTVANELIERRAQAHQRLYPSCEVIQGSITDEDVFDKIVAAHIKHKNRICFISCPCQDSSTFNTAESKGKGPRAALFKAALDFVEKTKPDYIVFENVPHWLEDSPEFAKDILRGKTIGDYVTDELKGLGYNFTVGILSAADYGTAEDRKRAIILACKKEFGIWKFPKKHVFQPTVFETIGLMKSLEAGDIDPDNKWHYGLPLEAHEIEFLKHTPVGCSAWNNAKKHQPKNKDGSTAGAQFEATYTRINPGYACNTIESGSGEIGDVHSVHFGRPLSDGTYSDARVLSIAEILKLIGADDDFLEPLNAPKAKADDFDGLTWEKGMLISRDERFIRTVLGEHVCPKFLLEIMNTLPTKKI